jgi:hypothetical protein
MHSPCRPILLSLTIVLVAIGFLWATAIVEKPGGKGRSTQQRGSR